ncbi:glycosyltransferase family 2 protein [Rhizobium lentis]|uniref:glycosyltransferase n=1 Tax=Rhizobium lentis TaxID=1138194 RepID=UPI001C837B8A|nr:glycosyltransferase [Rhizobium lentis]MBX5106093.1 glycosyltransferase family 2 protein [Rhizobium lentis]
MYQNERVTVGITCFNAHDTIGNAIRSAQSQEWPDLEIIIVDDASTDGSPERVASLIANDSRVRLISHGENGGAARARNTIIEAATGDFIVFFDDDDESAANRVMLQVAAIKAFEASKGFRRVACYASGERIYPNGYLKPLPAIGSAGTIPCGMDVADYLLFYRRRPDYFYGSGTPTCALMARRELFRELGGFDPSLKRVEDVDFAIRLALTGGCFIGTVDKLYLQHSTQGSDKSPDANHSAEIAVAKKHEGYLRSIGKYRYARHWPNLRYYHFKRQYVRFIAEFLVIAVRNPILAISHLLATGPKRLRHERRMNKRKLQ